MSEIGDSVSWRHIGDFIGLSRLKTMTFTYDIEDIRDRRLIYLCAARERGIMFVGFKLVNGVINAFRNNRELTQTESGAALDVAPVRSNFAQKNATPPRLNAQ